MPHRDPEKRKAYQRESRLRRGLDYDRERYYRKHPPRRGLGGCLEPAVRFWLKVWPRGDCWEWRGARDRDGYGQFSIGGRQLKAHRVAAAFVGIDVPRAAVIDHLCSHPWCVRPSHMLVTTPLANVMRRPGWLPAILARAAAITQCPQNHPYDEKNTYRNTKGSRVCRQCGRDATKRYMARKKAAA